MARRDIALAAEDAPLRGRPCPPDAGAAPRPLVIVAREHEPGASVARIGPTPLLMPVATEDTLAPTDLAPAAYNRALEPKTPAPLPGGRFDPHNGAGFERSSAAAPDRFARRLPHRPEGTL